MFNLAAIVAHGLFDPSPFHPVPYWLHLLVGALGLLGAIAALATRKGGRVHRYAGRVFMAGVAVAATSAIYFSFMRFAPPAILSAVVAVYAVSTSWLAIRRAGAGVRRLETTLSIVVLIAFLLFGVMASFAVARGVAPFLDAFTVAVPPFFLLLGDAWYFAHYDRRPRVRLFRHVSRMAWTLTIAVRAPFFELIDDFNLDHDLVVTVPLLIAPLILLVFGWRTLRIAAAEMSPACDRTPAARAAVE